MAALLMPNACLMRLIVHERLLGTNRFRMDLRAWYHSAPSGCEHSMSGLPIDLDRLVLLLKQGEIGKTIELPGMSLRLEGRASDSDLDEASVILHYEGTREISTAPETLAGGIELP